MMTDLSLTCRVSMIKYGEEDFGLMFHMGSARISKDEETWRNSVHLIGETLT